VYAEALALYRGLRLDQPRVRLVGVKVENLRPADEATQLALDLNGAEPRSAGAADRAIDALTARFGDSAVRPASLLRHRPVPNATRALPSRGADLGANGGNESSLRTGNRDT
jgi:DNA polymerase-4